MQETNDLLPLLNKKVSRFAQYLKRPRRGKLYNIGKTLLNLLLLCLLLYIFMLSITLMGAAFKLFGKEFANQLIATTTNPLVGLVIGILATSIIQSSSTTTSIVVGLVGCDALTIANAIPIIMGANVGTSITNTLVSVGHISISSEFERAFSASIVHDFFNFIAVLIFFPVQYYIDLLGISAHFLADTFQHIGGMTAISPIGVITAPAI
ncbi:MAG: Na/Pi symporter, partial [bacterium]|nr:Na/Pi symporter [bacterium]